MASKLLNKLAGKKVLIHGRYGYGEKEMLASLVEAHGATLLADVEPSLDYLVLPDLGDALTLQKKVSALNKKGANVQVIDKEAFENLVMPKAEDVVRVLREGSADMLAKMLASGHHVMRQVPSFGVGTAYTFAAPATGIVVAGEKFDRMSLSGFDLSEVRFENCSFVGTEFSGVEMGPAENCDFSGSKAVKSADGEFSVKFQNCIRCQFVNARLQEASFEGEVTGSNFTKADLEKTSWSPDHVFWNPKKKNSPGESEVAFNGAILRQAKFHIHLKGADFQGADLRDAELSGCEMEGASFREANLEGAVLSAAKLKGADFSNANLRRANLAYGNICNANVAGADIDGCLFRGADITGTDLSCAQNREKAVTEDAGRLGPALLELDSVAGNAKHLLVRFRIGSADEEGEIIGMDLNGLRGGGISGPAGIHMALWAAGRSAKTFSATLLVAGNLAGDRKVRFETVEVETSKASKQGKEMRDLAIRAIAEAFGQTTPPEQDLAAATKAYRDKDKEKNAAAKEEREKQKAAAEKAREKEKKQAEKKIEKAVGGKVKDIGTFLTALELRIEKEKIKKATSMLKKAGFQLYNDVTDTFMSGVVKSQTDADLVYACRINSDGTYACCTQNLNICGGLRGSICKHLLVLIIGLVKAEKLDPVVIDGWVAKSMHEKAALDKEVMGEIFIKYKGAEAGEVDWRPTETLPEDYYAV